MVKLPTPVPGKHSGMTDTSQGELLRKMLLKRGVSRPKLVKRANDIYQRVNQKTDEEMASVRIGLTVHRIDDIINRGKRLRSIEGQIYLLAAIVSFDTDRPDPRELTKFRNAFDLDDTDITNAVRMGRNEEVANALSTIGSNHVVSVVNCITKKVGEERAIQMVDMLKEIVCKGSCPPKGGANG